MGVWGDSFWRSVEEPKKDWAMMEAAKVWSTSGMKYIIESSRKLPHQLHDILVNQTREVGRVDLMRGIFVPGLVIGGKFFSCFMSFKLPELYLISPYCHLIHLQVLSVSSCSLIGVSGVWMSLDCSKVYPPILRQQLTCYHYPWTPFTTFCTSGQVSCSTSIICSAVPLLYSNQWLNPSFSTCHHVDGCNQFHDYVQVVIQEQHYRVKQNPSSGTCRPTLDE